MKSTISNSTYEYVIVKVVYNTIVELPWACASKLRPIIILQKEPEWRLRIKKDNGLYA